MPLQNNRGILASAAIVVVAVVAMAVAVNYFPAQSPVRTSSNSTTSSFGLGSGSGLTSTSSLTTRTSTSGFSIVASRCNGNCTIDVPWTSVYHLYQNFTDLTTDSEAVLLANVTSEVAALVNGIPISEYNITMVQDVLRNTVLKPGAELPVAQVGGTAGGITMNIKGDPPLSVGKTYILFLSLPGGKIIPINPGISTAASTKSTTVINGTTITFSSTMTASYRHTAYDPLAGYVLPVDNGDARVTVGGPQGVFYVQGGNVYSLDNTYPQDDSWLPLKVSGVPLAQFIQGVQAAAGMTTTTTSTSSKP